MSDPKKRLRAAAAECRRTQEAFREFLPQEGANQVLDRTRFAAAIKESDAARQEFDDALRDFFASRTEG